MSSAYSQRDEYGDSGGWRGTRQGGNRGRGNKSSGPSSSSSGGRSEINHVTVEEYWNDGNDTNQGSGNGGGGGGDWEGKGVSRGRGFSRSNRLENSSYQRQAYSGGGYKGGGDELSFGNQLSDDDDGGIGGWDDGTNRSEKESSYGGMTSKIKNDRFADTQEWETSINKLNIRDPGSGRGRGYNRQSRTEDISFQKQEVRTSLGSEEGDRQSNRGRGGFRGGGRGFRDARNDDTGSGGNNDDNWREDDTCTSRSSGGGRFDRRDDQADGSRGRGFRDSNSRSASNRDNDRWGDNETGSYRGRGGGGSRFGRRDDEDEGDGHKGWGRGFRDSRNDGDDNDVWGGDGAGSNRSRGGSRFTRRDDGGDQGDGRRGRGGRGGGPGRGFSNRGNDDNDNIYRGARGNNEENEDDKPRERYIPPAPADDEETVFGSAISTGNNFSNYDNIPVKVSGENVPQPLNSFEECNFKQLLLDNVIKSGYTRPTPVQKHAIPAIASGRDVMGCAQTGSGKTAAFLLPIIQALLQDKIDLISGEWAEPQVVICSPTRELSQQIYNEARKFAFGSIIKVAIAYGGTAVYHQASQIAKGCHILVATPGRLNDFVGRGRIKFSSCRFFVLDEADRMLDMGFLPAIEKMLDHETMTPKGQRQTLMFSATFPDDIQRLASNYLNEYLFLAVGIVGGACADVEQNFHLVPRFEKKDKLIEILSRGNEKELTLVFVEKQRTADFIAAFLSENQFPTTSIHGARLQSQREQALADFKSGRMPTLVATAVAARGLDIKNVTHVVNFDMPSSIEEYVHRIGRTGRVGNRGKATSFYDPDSDAQLIRGLIRILQQNNQEIPSFFDGANDPPSFRGGPGSRRSQNFGGHDVRGGEDIFNSGPTVVHEEVEESWEV